MERSCILRLQWNENYQCKRHGVPIRVPLDSMSEFQTSF